MLLEIANDAMAFQEETGKPAVPEDNQDKVINDIFSGILHRDSGLLAACAKAYNIPVPVFIFSTHQTVIPFLEAYAEKIKGVLDAPIMLDFGFCLVVI